MAKKNKSVTFQLDDPHEAQLYEAAQLEHNFSGLIKRLYARHLDDIERRKLADAGLPIRISGGGITYRMNSAGGTVTE